jgi:hypothetical protein
VNNDPEQEQEWVRQNSLSYVGLIGVGLVMIQPFLTAASLDASAKICVVAFAVAIPLLAALVMVSYQEAFRRRSTPSALVTLAKPVAMLSAFVGVTAGFWHIEWFAGVAILAAGAAAVGVHSAGFWRLELVSAGRRPRSSDSERS